MTERFRPSSTDELKDLIAWAAAEVVPLELIGAGTKRALGRPVEATHELHLDGLRGIGLYEPEELVMSAQAGTPLAEVEARLVDNRQQLTFEPPDYGAVLGGARGGQTIGGVFACNLAGPRRIKAGAARDHILGVQAVTGRGDLIKAGGRVVKNVTGYDLAKLLCGSHGTLAALTEVTFKVLPAPETTQTLVTSHADRAICFRALRLATGSASDVSAAACLPPAGAARSGVGVVADQAGHLGLLRLEGPAASVSARLAALKAELAPLGAGLTALDDETSTTLWREIRDLALLRHDAALVWRLSVPPTAGPEILARIEAEASVDWLADWAGGALWLAFGEDARAASAGETPLPEDGHAATVRAAAGEVSGHATLIRAPLALRRHVAPFQPQPAPLARLTARVKDGFDPQRILNPGRMYADL